MRRTVRLLGGALAAVMVTATPALQAGWSVGVRFNFPFGGHCCHPHYCRPYPVFVHPAPVFVQPVPVYQPVQPLYPAPATSYAPPAPDGDVERYQQGLQHPDDRERAEAALQLGRLRAAGSVAPLSAALSNDRSPRVRDAAARALGLLGSPEALTALQRAAQADEDRDVRRSASYAAEVIRTNLSRR